MKSPLSVNEDDLLYFFGASPVEFEPGLPWAYNDSVYEIAETQTHLSFAIAPAVRDVRIVITVGGVRILEFNAMGIKDLMYHKEKRLESLEVLIAPGNSLWLSTTPHISIRQSVDQIGIES